MAMRSCYISLLSWLLLGNDLAAAWINCKRVVALHASSNSAAGEKQHDKVLVLGGTGFVGSRVVDLLREKNVPCVATSTSGRDGTVVFDITDDDAPQRLRDICLANEQDGPGVTAIISTVGSMFDDRDYEINSASGRVAADVFAPGAGDERGAMMPRFIFVGNSPRIRNVCNVVSSLKEYARGKEESERLIEQTFEGNSVIIKPTFIYGGDAFGLNPPRLPGSLGEIVEALLGLYPVQATSEFLPDILGVPLEAPVKVDAVAGAAVNAALGLCDDSHRFDTREDIIMAASQRTTVVSGLTESEMGTRRDELKTILSTRAKEHTPDENFAMLEELERVRPSTTRPTEDATLNGRWDFCFDVEPDVGTGFIKDIFEGNGPEWVRKIVDPKGVHMEIGDDQGTIQLVVTVALFERDATLVLHTSLSPAERNVDGTMFMERFEGIEFNGFRLPYPEAWKRSRYLEFSYLDEGFAIARGAGGEPHFLLKGQ